MCLPCSLQTLTVGRHLERLQQVEKPDSVRQEANRAFKTACWVVVGATLVIGGLLWLIFRVFKRSADMKADRERASRPGTGIPLRLCRRG